MIPTVGPVTPSTIAGAVGPVHGCIIFTFNKLNYEMNKKQVVAELDKA